MTKYFKKLQFLLISKLKKNMRNHSKKSMKKKDEDEQGDSMIIGLKPYELQEDSFKKHDTSVEISGNDDRNIKRSSEMQKDSAIADNDFNLQEALLTDKI